MNDQLNNQMTLHTNPGCTMPTTTGMMTGQAGNLDCEGNNGCAVTAAGTWYSYGPGFNSIGGGWYAMERSTWNIKVWFWPRYGPVPSDVQNPTGTVNTDSWVRDPLRRGRAQSELTGDSAGYPHCLLPQLAVQP